ncbi:DNA repair protein RecO [Candidatus Gastranaerophilus sp. (ex Termes propinquus)]|nr:DNA repair protein RecO [Candidatus Gastranaerophilus sp. (ex Termes propinquus)]
MKNFTTDAINIKTYPLSEFDNIVVMFSKQKGLIKGVARGVKRPKSKLGARMQMLVANKLMLYEGKNLNTVCQAQALNTFSKTRQNLDKLSYSLYLAEIIGAFCQAGEDKNNENIYELFYAALFEISESKDIVEILLNTLKFQLGFMQMLGYGIELERCLVCGNAASENSVFSLLEGGIVCGGCKSYQGERVKIPLKIREFLLALSGAKPGVATKYDELVNEKVVHVCFSLLKKYINTQSSRPIKSLSVLGCL